MAQKDFKVKNNLLVGTGAGDEGGQIELATAVTNTVLNNSVIIDVYQNKLRFFENGGTYKGYYIDISGGTTNAGTDLTASGGGGTWNGGTVTNAATFTSAAPQITISNGTSNTIKMAGNGLGAPSFTSYSAGAKLVTFDNISGSSAGHAIGAETGYMWFGVSDTGNGFKWYGGTSQLASLSGSGTLVASIFESTNNGNGTNFKVGDDAWIGDVNIADTIRIKGQQNSNNGYIIFGDSDSKKLGRAGTGALTYDGNTVYHSGNLVNATTTVPGLIELFSDTVQSVTANAVTTTSSRTYGIQLNGSGQAVVNVPWTDTGWDGGSSGLVASTGRASLGATTVGSNLFTLTDVGAVSFIKINADNTITTESASTFRSSIGAGTGNGDAVLASANAFTGANTFTNATGQTFRPGATQDGIIILGRAGGTSSYDITLATATLTADRTITFPDKTGIVATSTLDLDKTTVGTSTTTVVISDNTLVGKTVYCTNTGTCTITVNGDASVVPEGAQITFIRAGTGPVNFASGTNATVNATPGLKIRAQWSMATLVKTVESTTDTWVLVGDISA